MVTDEVYVAKKKNERWEKATEGERDEGGKEDEV